MRRRHQDLCRRCAVAFVIVVLTACSKAPQSAPPPHIEFTKIPEARRGGPGATTEIAGRVRGARNGQRIILFAKSGVWYIQPRISSAFTPIGSDAQWKNTTHFGTDYAALLVNTGYSPPAQVQALPSKGGMIAAVAQVTGRHVETAQSTAIPAGRLRFSQFDWEVRSEPNDRGGSTSEYDPANAWVDDRGRLHLRITKGPRGWRCSEIRLLDSLGYGTYSLAVENIAHLDSAAVLGFYTFDPSAPNHNFREMNIELSRWGEPVNKNAQYAIQPFYVPANVVRFMTPSGRLSHSLRWSPGRVDFRTTHSENKGVIAGYAFTSGVPAPGEESVFISLYAYTRARSPLTREAEVVVEQFQYTP